MTLTELLDKFYDIANGGEGELSDIFVEDFDLGIAPGFPYGGDYNGMDGVSEFFSAYKKHFDIWTVTIDRYMPVGDDQMVATGSYTARVADTGAGFQMETAHVWMAENGRLKSLKQYCDTAILSDAMDNDVPKRA